MNAAFAEPRAKFSEWQPRWQLVSSLCLVLILQPLTARCQDAWDRVLVQPSATQADVWESLPVEVIQGRVSGMNSKQLSMVDDQGQPRTVDCQRMQSVELAWKSPAVIDALELLAKRETQSGVNALYAASTQLPGWQQQLLVGKIVQAADAVGNPRTTGVLFLKLVASQPPACLYADIPLCWTIREPDAALAAAARQWLSAEEDAAQLLGASWLLFGAESELARRKLNALQASSDAVIGQLAVAQSWRLVPPPDTLNELPKWLQFRDGLLEPLQLGPTEFIADRMQRIGETELAIGQWMRIATLHADRYHRALAAVENAAASLRRLGRESQAQQLETWMQELDGLP